MQYYLLHYRPPDFGKRSAEKEANIKNNTTENEADVKNNNAKNEADIKNNAGCGFSALKAMLVSLRASKQKVEKEPIEEKKNDVITEDDHDEQVKNNDANEIKEKPKTKRTPITWP